MPQVWASRNVGVWGLDPGSPMTVLLLAVNLFIPASVDSVRNDIIVSGCDMANEEDLDVVFDRD